MFDEGAVAEFERRYRDTIVGLLGLRLTGVRPDGLVGEMVVGKWALNSQGVLHGGVSALVAETMASYASLYPLIGRPDMGAGGISLHISHLRKGIAGETITADVRPLRLARSVHFWQVEIANHAGELLSVSQVAVKVGKREDPPPAHASPVSTD